MVVAVKELDQVRLAVFLTSFHPGGTERQMVELVRRLDRERFRVYAPCLHREGAWLARATESASEVPEFTLRGFADPSAIAAVRRFAAWCRERAIDAVLTADFYANIVGLTGAALARVPVRLASRRELAPDKGRAQLALQRAAYGFAHRIVANSPAAAAQVRREGISAKRVRVIPNGLDITRFAAAARRRPLRRIITVANLRPEKRHDLLLDAVALLAPRFPDLRVQLVGEGPGRAALETRAAAIGIADRVEFLGHREDVPALLAAADLFVLPSRSEAFPNGVLEAMVTGLPVVACEVGGLLDLIDNGRSGALVQPDSAPALAAAIERLLANPELAARLAAEGRRHVRDRYSFDRMVSAFEDLIVNELEARRARPRSADRAAVTVS
jgi:glycosyltransferase involved in cell wall biosynthesis